MKSLIDEVFSWSIHDILNEQLYEHKVWNIPDSFNGAEDYFGSFVYPLLEETRAQLCENLNNISKAPYAQVVEVSKRKDEKQLYDIKVDYWRNLLGVRGNAPYKICVGDILLFTDSKPEAESDSDLLRLWSHWARLAQVRGDNDRTDQTDICLLVNSSSSDFKQEMSSEMRSLFVVFLMNLRTGERILKSLQMDANVALSNQVLGASTHDDLKCGLCSSKNYLCDYGVDDSILTLASELNKSQKEVLFDILSKVQCNHKSFMEPIQGPPGSGKTKTLSILLFALLKMKCRTLICAPTDNAIVDLASHVLKLVKEFSPCSLSGILYYGDDNAANVDMDMKEIYMDYHERSMEVCLQTASLVFCTASNAYALHFLKAKPLDLLIIDESAQLKEAEASIPLQLPGCRNVVLFGDHHQLGAEVTSNVSARAGFARSLFERLISMVRSKHILNMQYRMHPSISCFPNKKFYANQIVDATTVRNRCYTKFFLPGPMFGPYSFINISCGYEEFDSFRNSFKNMVEVSIVTAILKKLFKAWSTKKHKLSVGVISPFISQVVAIKERIGRKYGNIDGFSLQVNTIEGFQGGEEDMIILSTVTTNADILARCTFNTKRTNVALTRARHCLWIVGDAKTLSGCNSIWKFIIQDAKDRYCFYDAEEDQDLASVIIQVKEELDQFDSFLNEDSSLFKNARWKVLFSSNFRKSFDKLKSSETKKLVINLLLRLSCGWRPKRGNSYCDSSSKMLRQFKVRHMHIICSIDIQKDLHYIQVLKVWDMLPMEGILQLVNRLDSLFKSYADEFVQRCKTRYLEGDLEVPMSWSTSIDRYKKGLSQNEIDPSSHASDYVENCKATDSLLLMKFYSLSTRVVNHLLSTCDGNEMDLPFELTDEEKDIVFFRRSSFILGRSGCGKTTVLIMKLFQKEQLHHLAIDGFHEVERNDTIEDNNEEDILRQVFVTVNPRLCYSVKQYISRLKRWTFGWNSAEECSKSKEEDIDEMSEFSDIPDSFVGLPKCSYPLVITFKKFLMMLNGTVGRSFFERFPELQGFCQQRRRGCRSMTLKTFIRRKEVDYTKFCSSYWPNFSNQLTQHLDMSSVFTEIISHIKGGFRAGVHDDLLSREDYVSYSERRLRPLTEHDRGRIYDTFVEYEKKKTKQGEFDLADLVIDLHQRMGDFTYEGEKMDFVYIDEVQDLTMRQISLFKYVCRNFDEGFVFSGDTAQTIARGIDFKFQNIRALFYKEFGAQERQSKGEITDVFQLKQNFRTHAGVLKLANSILELLYYFFPASIDKLQPESSLLNGPKPVWLQAENGASGLASLFKNGNVYHAFGAKQVILVRDEDDKRELFDLLGKQTLVLTVMDCKGLEFDDVLLYNFFSSSLVRDHWDVIYEYTRDQNLQGSLAMKSSPRFDKGKHIALCSELKQLYVAITRTRQRLWIFDEESIPIFRYWDELCLVNVSELNEAFIQEVLVESSLEEWKAQGIEFFHQKNYEKANFCFEKAGDSYWSKRGKAALLRCTAERLSYLNFKVSRDRLIDAALLYEEIGKNESAAQCFFEAREYEKAGLIYLEKFGDSRLEEAAECFSLAGSYEKAAEIYVQCKSFGKFLSVCTTGNLFEMGYKYIKSWKLKNLERFIKGEEIQRFLEEGACHFNKILDSESMMRFVEAFESVDQIRTFLKHKGCLLELMLFEKKRGNISEAIEVAHLKGDVLIEADFLEIAERYEEASKLIVVYVLYNSLWVKDNKGWPLKNFEEKQNLLKRATTLASNVSGRFNKFICCTANILSQGSDNLYNLERQWNDICGYGNVMSKILCARRILDLFLNHRFVPDLISLSQNRKLWNETSTSNLLIKWNFWHNEIKIVLEKLQDHSSEDSHTEFCENYFGVTKQLKKGKTVYLLLYPEANWVNHRFIKKKGELHWIDSDVFVQAAKGFWSSEIVTVGVKVLEILKALYTSSADNDLSLFCQCMLLIQIYKTAKPLIESKNMNHTSCDIVILQRFVKVTVDHLFGLMYQLDWKNMLTEDMIYLREKHFSWELLKEICKQIGMRVTAVLSVKFHPNLLKQIAGYMENSALWRDFTESLKTFGQHGPINYEMFVVRKFHDALKATDFVEFSPSCFCYLLDRLLLMVSSLKCDFATSRCSLVEWLIFMDWRKNSDLEFGDSKHLWKSETVDFVACTVKKILSDEEEMLNWIKKFNLSMNCYPELVLRLFVILAVLCVNFGGYSGLFFELMGSREITSLLPWKFYQSMKKLTEAERKEMEIEVVAEAFKEIGNPLVIVNVEPKISIQQAIYLNLKVEQYKESILRCLGLKNRPRFGGKQLRRSLSLKINEQDLNIISETPERTVGLQDHVMLKNPVGTVELQHKNILSETPEGIGELLDQNIMSETPERIGELQDQIMSENPEGTSELQDKKVMSETPKGSGELQDCEGSSKLQYQSIMSKNPEPTSEMQQSNKYFWMMLGSVVFETCSKETNFISDVSKLKELVLDYIILVNAKMKSKSVDKSERAFDEDNEVVDQLQQLYSALCSSLQGDEDILMIQRVVEKLQSRRATMESRMDVLLSKRESDLKGKL